MLCHGSGVRPGLLYLLLFNGAFAGGIAGYVASWATPAHLSVCGDASGVRIDGDLLVRRAGSADRPIRVLPGRLTRVASLELAARETSLIVSAPR